MSVLRAVTVGFEITEIEQKLFTLRPVFRVHVKNCELALQLMTFTERINVTNTNVITAMDRKRYKPDKTRPEEWAIF